MRRNSDVLVPSALALITAMLTLAGLGLLVLTLDRPFDGWGFRGFPAIFALENATIGWLIMVRRPDNPIGILLAIAGLVAGVQVFATEYAEADPALGLPLADWVAWVNAYVWVAPLTIMAGVIPLAFPDGALPSPRWRPVAWLIGIGAAGVALTIAIAPASLGTGADPTPPIAIGADPALVDNLSNVSYAVLLAGFAGAAGSLLWRWRRATGLVREQLKWLAWAGAIVVVVAPVTFLSYFFVQLAFIAAVALLPLGVGIAILRYRLYEIDTVIGQTLVFAVLTALLAGLFAALQRVLQGVFVAATGNESDAALVITTLILATTFAPLKKALERVVERRFKASRAAARAAGLSDEADEGPERELEAMLRRVLREELGAARATERSEP